MRLAHFVPGIVDVLRHLAMSVDTSDLRVMDKLVDKFGADLKSGTFARLDNTKFITRTGLPHTNVHFIRSGKDVAIIQ